MRCRTLAVSLAAASLPSAAAAQFVQYTMPGSLLEPRETRAEAARQAAEEARWSLGKLRLAPLLGVRDVGYIDNVYDTREDGEPVSDFRGTGVAGLDAFLHLGPESLFSAWVRPEYVSWQEQDELSEFEVSYGAGLFSDFNRLDLELVGERLEEQGYVNDELRVPVDVTTDTASLRADVDFRGPFSLFAGASFSTIDLPPTTPEGAVPVTLEPLDRDETLFDLGLVYELANGLEVGVGAERSEVEFDDDPGGRSNEGTSPLFSLRLGGNRFDLDLRAVQRRLTYDSADLPETEEVTGALRAGWLLGTRSDLAVYGSRQLVYSALDAGAVYTSAIYGLGAGWGRLEGERPQPRLSLFAETGEDRYEETGGDLTGRLDDLTSWGVTVQVPLRRLAILELGWIESEVDSNVDLFDRSYATIRTALTLRSVGLGGS
jgi:hypothetical protein